ncbi:MAG: hypothetical protein VB096_02515 [Pseudoflavonifractor sp.]|nr:hypothetical protein [Pseudoflavonifractor sp.]
MVFKTFERWGAHEKEEKDAAGAGPGAIGTVETLEHIKGLMDEQWESRSREMGLKADSSNYGKDNPLIAMRRCRR